MDLRERIARMLPKVTVTVTGLAGDAEFLDWDYHTADAILELPEIKAALERKCDLCDETGKATLRCNECAQIMAND
jgi:hypothetical protein